MALLTDLRGMLTRRKPVMVDVAHSQASGLSRASSDGIEPKSLPSPSPSISPTDKALASVLGIEAQIETQTMRIERLTSVVEKLSVAVTSLPEIARQNTRFLDAFGEFLAHARKRDDAFNHTLSGITAASTRQADVLGLVQQQLDAQQNVGDTLARSLGDLRETLGQLGGASARTTNVLSELVQAGEDRERDLALTLARTQRWMIAAFACCGATAATGVVIAAIALFS
jgi:ABC-type transporter Mla subunit MlaD